MHTLEGGGAWHLLLGLIHLRFSCHVTHSDILILRIVKFSVDVPPLLLVRSPHMDTGACLSSWNMIN